MKVFTIQPDGRFDVAFRLAVFNTRKEMRAAIKRDLEKEHGGKFDDTSDRTMGMFHPAPGMVDINTCGVGYPNVFGTMYLNLADVSGEIIVHECAHAAFAWEFNVRHYTGKFDDDSFEEQEAFCYFLGRAVEKVREVIRKNYKTRGGMK